MRLMRLCVVDTTGGPYALVDDRRRGLHDMIAGTFVVQVAAGLAVATPLTD